MDPPVMMNGGGGFRSGNSGSSMCNMPEIWPFPMNLGGNTSSFGVGQLEDNNNNNSGGAFIDSDSNINININNNTNNNNQSKKRREDDDSSKGVSTSNCMTLAVENENVESKPEAENAAKACEPPKQDYIHVRARRGQATDSHSLAERARREKISERMKILQDLVPGCNKVIGKALVLDEIINYIQSLQQQVEFLSMKLEAVTSRSHPSPQGFPSKDFGQQAYDMGGVQFGSQTSREFSRGSSPEWLHMQIGGGFERTT